MVKYTAGKSLKVKTAVPEMAGSGREVAVFIGPKFTTKIATFSRWVELIGSSVLNDIGGGSITLDMTDPQLADPMFNDMDIDEVLLGNNLWRVYMNGKPQFEFIPDSVTYNDTAPGAASTVTIAGRGPGALLEKAVVLPPGFPKQTAKFWSFKNTPMMSAWLQLYTACRSRGTIPAFRPMFSAKKDSAGRKWDDLITAKSLVSPYVPELGDSLMNLLQKLTGQDTGTASQLRCEWAMWPGMKLYVQPKIGVDRSQKVVFIDGADIISRSRTLVSQDIFNYIAVRDVYGGMSLAKYRGSTRVYGQLEQLFQHELVVNSSMRMKIARMLLDKQKTEKVSWTIQIRADVTGKEPYVDFNIGDWISFDVYDARKQTSTTEKLRVMSITISDTPTAQEAELVLETVLDAKVKEISRDITYLLNSINKAGTKIIKTPSTTINQDLQYNNDYGSDLGSDYGLEADLGAYPDFTDYIADTGLVDNGDGTYTAAPISRGIAAFFQTDEPTETQAGDIWIDYMPEDPLPEITLPAAEDLFTWPEEDWSTDLWEDTPEEIAQPPWTENNNMVDGMSGYNYDINPNDMFQKY